MGNTLRMDKKDLIKRLLALGWSNRKINRSTGIHRDTVSNYRKWLFRKFRTVIPESFGHPDCPCSGRASLRGGVRKTYPVFVLSH